MDPDIWGRAAADEYDWPDGWSEHDYIFSNGVLYHHGETAVADFGYGKDARNRMCNTVSGHAHGNFGIAWTANDTKVVYGMAVGCGVAKDSPAFLYGLHFKRKPMIGCAVVLENGTLPVCFPMPLGSKR